MPAVQSSTSAILHKRLLRLQRCIELKSKLFLLYDFSGPDPGETSDGRFSGGWCAHRPPVIQATRRPDSCVIAAIKRGGTRLRVPFEFEVRYEADAYAAEDLGPLDKETGSWCVEALLQHQEDDLRIVEY